MTLKCNLCQNEFKEKQFLRKHLNDKRCKSNLLNNWLELNEYIESLKKNQIHNQQISNAIVGGEHNTYINVKIEINPITKLDLSHIEPVKMKSLIEKYDDNKSPDKLNLLLSDYIKDVICNKDHPENHSIKYVKKKPPTYNCIIEDENGNTIETIKGLRDSCELLSDPILNTLKTKLQEFLSRYKKDEEFDYGMYRTTIHHLKKELDKTAVKKALSAVLQNDILNNIQMKLNISGEQN
jgi:hypothetical protein